MSDLNILKILQDLKSGIYNIISLLEGGALIQWSFVTYLCIWCYIYIYTNSVIVLCRGSWVLMNGIMQEINFRPFELCTHTQQLPFVAHNDSLCHNDTYVRSVQNPLLPHSVTMNVLPLHPPQTETGDVSQHSQLS